ncbi:Alpha-N-acetylglucosaminidase [Nymphon striatum]|nr:Alpha-N-acetylglucosaminidase [Nymphon striatum]
MFLKVIFISIIYVIQIRDEFKHLNEIRTKTSPAEQEAAVRGLIQRLIPSKHALVNVVIDPNLGPKLKDTFQVKTSVKGILSISGNNGVAASLGLYHYLKYYCNCHVSWSGNQLSLPKEWPEVNLTMTTNDRFRYYQNVCTVSYSMVWWDWARWEQEIDWMALNGINLPLAFNGQEAIFERAYLKIGLNRTHLDNFFTGPAFLAWGRMGNIQIWDGPLPMSWHVQQVALQHKILKRMRQFGMLPVLPGFSGHVPPGLKTNYPNANISKFGGWARFTKPNGTTYFLEPSDPLFHKLTDVFTKELVAEFGTDHVYNIDLYNELTPSSGSIDYVSKTSRAVYNSLVSADPKAIWLAQAWMFLNAYWTVPRAKAFLTSSSTGSQLLLLDLAAERYPQYSRFENFYGQPFIWCMLANYGGKLGLFSQYSRRRYGFTSQGIQTAMQLLMRSVYNSKTGAGIDGNYIVIWYNVSDVFNAWKLFAGSRDVTPIETFKHDIVDITRESLQLIFDAKYKQVIAAFNNKSLETLMAYSMELLEVLGDMDLILATNKHFLLGNWVRDARSMSNDTKEQMLYEMNAKNQISLWGPKGEILDYATKQWSGVLVDYFLPRWKLFVDMLASSVKSGKSFPAQEFEKRVFEEAEKPFSNSIKQYPTTETGSSIKVSQMLLKKYEGFIDLAKSLLQ